MPYLHCRLAIVPLRTETFLASSGLIHRRFTVCSSGVALNRSAGALWGKFIVSMALRFLRSSNIEHKRGKRTSRRNYWIYRCRKITPQVRSVQYRLLSQKQMQYFMWQLR
jgi:hypothetical protein